MFWFIDVLSLLWGFLSILKGTFHSRDTEY